MGEYIDKTKGKAQQIKGRVTGDRSKEAEGVVREKVGEGKEAVEDLKRDIKNRPPR